MHTKIKLCGMMEAKEIQKANELAVDFVGYIFAKGRFRTIDIDTAKEFTKLLSPEITPVGVFRNNDINEVIQAANTGCISYIQLHGNEDEDYINILRNKLKLKLIKAYEIKSGKDIEEANNSSADFVLLDTPGAGTGETFDHSLLSGMKRDYFLAGGLNPSNVGENIKKYRPFAVDVSSGIETDKKKDTAKMQKFTEECRKYEW